MSLNHANIQVLLLSAGEMKCVREEGMPRYKNPYEKGQLIITFSVSVRAYVYHKFYLEGIMKTV